MNGIKFISSHDTNSYLLALLIKYLPRTQLSKISKQLNQ